MGLTIFKLSHFCLWDGLLARSHPWQARMPASTSGIIYFLVFPIRLGARSEQIEYDQAGCNFDF